MLSCQRQGASTDKLHVKAATFFIYRAVKKAICYDKACRHVMQEAAQGRGEADDTQEQDQADDAPMPEAAEADNAPMQDTTQEEDQAASSPKVMLAFTECLCSCICSIF